jgi:hypothetical protein
VLLNYPVILDKPLSFNFPMDFENSLWLSVMIHWLRV